MSRNPDEKTNDLRVFAAGTEIRLDCTGQVWYTECVWVFQSIHPNFTEISKLRGMITSEYQTLLSEEGAIDGKNSDR